MSDHLLCSFTVAAGTIGGLIAWAWLRKYFKRTIIFEYQHALLYKNGVFSRTLPAGSYWLWTPSDHVMVADNRRATVTLAGQEIVTADNVGVKLSVLLTYRVVDAVKALNQTQGWYQDLYASVQLAARDVLSVMKVEEILQARSPLGDKLLELVKPQAEQIGVEVLMVQLKDVILPAEIRKIFGDVLRAQKEGLAALERARGEQAALRTLANAARMLEGNPALMNLRVLQALSGQGGNVPPTVVLGVPQGLLPVPNSPPSPQEHQTQAEHPQ
jgi:regulator of protease activity HflC (stomatin/prohibitin superfamily)